MTVTLLEKQPGENWSSAEISTIKTRCGVEVEVLETKSHRLVVSTESPRQPIETVLSGTVYTTREIEFRDRWM